MMYFLSPQGLKRNVAITYVDVLVESLGPRKERCYKPMLMYFLSPQGLKRNVAIICFIDAIIACYDIRIYIYPSGVQAKDLGYKIPSWIGATRFHDDLFPWNHQNLNHLGLTHAGMGYRFFAIYPCTCNWECPHLAMMLFISFLPFLAVGVLISESGSMQWGNAPAGASAPKIAGLGRQAAV